MGGGGGGGVWWCSPALCRQICVLKITRKHQYLLKVLIAHAMRLQDIRAERGMLGSLYTTSAFVTTVAVDQ